MTVVPRPSADFGTVTLPKHSLAKGTNLWRIHSLSLGPLWFGPGRGRPPAYRFDDPTSTYGVCYLGETHYAAFVETFFRDLPTRAISTLQLRAKAISQCVLKRDVTLAAAFGPGLVRLGTTAAVSGARGAGGSYAHSQEWSRALFDHPAKVDGIAYQASHDDSLRCVALFERASRALAVARTSGPLTEEVALVAGVVKRYAVAIL